MENSCVGCCLFWDSEEATQEEASSKVRRVSPAHNQGGLPLIPPSITVLSSLNHLSQLHPAWFFSVTE